MKLDKNELNFVLASDENYVDKLGVALLSIMRNHYLIDKVNIHILSNNILEDSLLEIKKLASNFTNTTITIHNLNNLKSLIGIEVNVDHLSLAAYARIFIPKLLPSNLEKALYLDVDILVEKNLEELFNTNLNGYFIGGVKSIMDLANRENENNQFHINSGVILWNLEKCRNDNFVSKSLDFIMASKGNLKFHDQTTINKVCLGKIKSLHPKYNVMSGMLFLNYNKFIAVYGLDNYYSKKEYIEAVESPHIIHLTSWVVGRPWEKECMHPYKDKYFELLNKTPWKNNTLLKNKKSTFNSSKRFLYKILPGVIIRFSTKFKRKIKASKRGN